jgi:uncharacterized damage-inducible protein DinB
MTRTPQDIAKLFAYGRWANAQTLGSVGALDAEELARPVGGSFGSVLGTLVHLYGADWVWLERWHGKSPRALPDAQEIASLDALQGRWTPVEDGMRLFAESLTAERMSEPLTYVSFKGDTFTRPLGETLVHIANHGTYHRGQVATLLRQLGKTPVSTDYLLYLDAVAK